MSFKYKNLIGMEHYHFLQGTPSRYMEGVQDYLAEASDTYDLSNTSEEWIGVVYSGQEGIFDSTLKKNERANAFDFVNFGDGIRRVKMKVKIYDKESFGLQKMQPTDMHNPDEDGITQMERQWRISKLPDAYTLLPLDKGSSFKYGDLVSLRFENNTYFVVQNLNTPIILKTGDIHGPGIKDTSGFKVYGGARTNIPYFGIAAGVDYEIIKNGQIPDDIDGKPLLVDPDLRYSIKHKKSMKTLLVDVKEEWDLLAKAYFEKFGEKLKISGYRTLAQQAAGNKKGSSKWRAGTGKSLHGLAVAVDIKNPQFHGKKANKHRSAFLSANYKWFDLNAPKYNWHNPGWARMSSDKEPWEPWHWEYLEKGNFYSN